MIAKQSMDGQPCSDPERGSDSAGAVSLTPPEHEHSAAITLAARWLDETPRSQRGPAVPEIRKRFGLTAAEAIEAIREARAAG